jgi:hypothetical protein
MTRCCCDDDDDCQAFAQHPNAALCDFAATFVHLKAPLLAMLLRSLGWQDGSLARLRTK